MEKISFISKIGTWLQTSEMFGRPSKQLPGKWQLYEYYIDTDDELLNFKQDSLNENKQFMEVNLPEDGRYSLRSNLPLRLLNKMDSGEWSVTKNFITFIHPDDYRNNLEFQFAFENGNLKFLKKDELGKIEFFGFFKREE